MALKAKISGRVTVEITIGTDGNVQAAKAVSGPQLLQSHAANWAKKWKFSPYIKDGHAQSAKFILNLDFVQ
jgi:TonB family protein